jgi:sulfur dioxygenase
MNSQVKSLKDLLLPGESGPAAEWNIRGVRSNQCLSYVAWNERTKEALVVDPKDEDIEAYRSIAKELGKYTWLGVIDSHTHADHISIAADLAKELHAPLVMHSKSPSERVQIRVSADTHLPSQAGPIHFVRTPGHTQDSLVVIWGPYLFGGDTVLIGDSGRDDLPGGSAEAHYDSLVKLKKIATPELIVLPGHDGKDGRATSWKTQLEKNPSLTQDRETFVRESNAFDGDAPKLLKKSLRENFK